MILPILPPAVALLNIPLYALTDREVGNGRKGLLSRSWAGAVAIVGGGVVGYLTLGPAFAFIGLLWMALRSLDFPDGTLDPHSFGKIVIDAGRYAAWIPAATLLSYWSGGGWRLAAIAMTAAALGSTAMRVWFGRKTLAGADGSFNRVVEIATGALFGAALAVYALAGGAA